MNEKKLYIICGVAGIITLGLMAMNTIGLFKLSELKGYFGQVSNTSQTTAPSSGPMGSPLANPTAITATAGASGSLPAGTYYLKITSTDYSGGQTLPTSELTCSPTVTATGSCTVALTLNARASTTRIWVATSTGVYYGYQSATSSTLIATTTGLTLGTIPTTNTAFNDIGVGRYQANPVTLTDGSLAALLLDALGNLKVTLQTSLSYLIDSILAVPYGHSYDYSAAAEANNVIKATAGVLHCIIVGTASSTATDIIEVSDHATDGDGNVVLLMTDPVPGTYCPDMAFGTGITADTTVQTNVTYIYR